MKFCKVEEARERKPPVRVESPVTESEPKVPREVSDEVTTFEARVVPVSDPAGAEPISVPVKFPVPLVKKRFVVEAVVEKKLVVVALVPVALTKVKFCNVDEPVTKRLDKVERPPVAVKVVPRVREPVRFAVEESVWPLIRPEVKT